MSILPAQESVLFLGRHASRHTHRGRRQATNHARLLWHDPVDGSQEFLLRPAADNRFENGGKGGHNFGLVLSVHLRIKDAAVSAVWVLMGQEKEERGAGGTSRRLRSDSSVSSARCVSRASTCRGEGQEGCVAGDVTLPHYGIVAAQSPH